MRSLISIFAFALVLGGCAAPDEDDALGYVSPDGSITILDESERPTIANISGEDLNGEPVSLDSFLGKKVVVLNVWGSWCPPCRAEAPELAAAAENNPDIQFFGIVLRDSIGSAQAFVKEFNWTYPNLFDPSGEQLIVFADSLPAVALPTTYVFDSEGRLAARIVDTVTEESLLSVIEQVNGGK